MATTLSKKKLLGQYFSGNKIAEALYDLLGSPKGVSVIDPMCGIGHLLTPFSRDNSSTIYGVELEADAYNGVCKAFEHLENCHLYNGNSFAKPIIKNYDTNGYDVVITNPPYIRSLIYEKGVKTIPGFISKGEINSNLISLIRDIKTLSENEKQTMIETINTVSGLADIAVQAWILCMSLVKHTGKLAMVVPETWLSREYSNPIVYLLKQMYEIDSIVNDANLCWFSGSAEVKTALVVCHRTNSVDNNHCIKIVDLYKEASDETNLFSFIGKDSSILRFLNIGMSLDGICEIKCISQNKFGNSENKSQIRNDATSKLNMILPFGSTRMMSLNDFGIHYGQGFRTGSNAFFVFKKDGRICRSSFGNSEIHYDSQYFKTIIQNQKSLGNGYVVDDGSTVHEILYLSKAVTRHDHKLLEKEYLAYFNILPADIESYILKATITPFNEKMIPQMSAVRTNNTGKQLYRRFWYNLPPISQRHIGEVFVPRVNGEAVIARLNAIRYIVDANFISFWRSSECPFTPYGLLALLNSLWLSIQYEEVGSVLGGGALKLDAIQLNKLFIPELSQKSIKVINELGEKLAVLNIGASRTIINKIDTLILSEIGVKADEVIPVLHDIINNYSSNRSNK